MYRKEEIMEGLKRLENEVLEMNDHNVSLIFDYLKNREDLIEKFNNEEKTIKGMYKYICDKARKQAKDNVAMVQDNVVYLWAITYFTKSNEELGIAKENQRKGLKEDDKKKKAENPNNEEKSEVKEEEKKENTDQISLFQEVKS